MKDFRWTHSRTLKSLKSSRLMISLLLTGAILLGLISLLPASPGVEAKGRDRIKVIASNFPAYDFLRQIGGDRLNLSMLIAPGAESHSYEPSPRDLVKLAEADLFVFTGGEGDAWVESILHTRPDDKPSLAMVDMVDLLDEETVEGMEEDHDHDHDHDGDHGHEHDEDHDHEHEDDHDHKHKDDHDQDHEEAESRRFSHSIDEHVWTDPNNAAKIAEALCQALVDLDPDHADVYQDNTDHYLAELKDLDQAFANLVKHAKRHTIVVGDRFPLRYFVEAYKLDYYAAFPGCSTQGDASPQTLTFLVDKVREEKLPVVFHIELSNEKLAKTIAEDTGAEVMLFHSCHNVSKEDFKAGVTYLDLMRKNLEALDKALND